MKYKSPTHIPANKKARERQQQMFEFVKANPGCTTADVVAHIAEISQAKQTDRYAFAARINNALLELQDQGRIRWVDHQYFAIEEVENV